MSQSGARAHSRPMIRSDRERPPSFGRLPVLVLQHLTGDGPAYLAQWLARHGIEADVRNTEAGHG